MQTIMAREDDALDTQLLIPSTFNKCIVSNVELGGAVSTVQTVPTMSLVQLGKKLLASARDGDTEQVQLLMSKGAPFTTDWLGTSPLHLAAQNGHLATAEVLLRAGISRDTRTKVDRTPLHLAAQEGNTDIVRLLIAHGALVDARDMLQMTPLHWAVEREHVDTIEVLLQHGADPNKLSKFEKTAFDIAMDNNRSDIIQLLHSVSAIPMTSDQEAATLQQSLEAEEATLAATQSLAMEMTQVPAPSQQEEVQTSATSAATNPEVELPVFQLDHTEDLSHETSVEPEKIIIHSTKTKADFNRPENASPRKTGISWQQRRTPQPQNTNPTLQLLQAHGITMLPADDTTLVASAVESGQTVVLTEAGKLALNLTQGSVSGAELRKSPGTATFFPRKPTPVTLSPNNKKKFITIRAGQILSKTGPNILKRIDPSGSGGPARKVIVTRGGIPIATTPKPATNNVTITSAADLEAITRQLEEARREAEEYKKLYSRKEREAEEYKQQLQSITQGGK